MTTKETILESMKGEEYVGYGFVKNIYYLHIKCHILSRLSKTLYSCQTVAQDVMISERENAHLFRTGFDISKYDRLLMKAIEYSKWL